MFPEWHHAVPESAYFKVPETLKTFRMYPISRFVYVLHWLATRLIIITGTAPTPGLHFFVTTPHFSPNRNIGPNYCTMSMLAIKHRHDDHNRLSSSGNLFFDVWHNLPFKKEGLLLC